MSTSRVSVRRMCMTGLPQRTISSAAVIACPSRSCSHRALLVRELGERPEPVADRVPRRLVAGGDEQQDERPEILRR